MSALPDRLGSRPADRPARGGPSPQWRRVLPPLALLLAGALWIYRDTAVGMVTIWARSDTFAHAFVVPPIVAWLIWRLRRELAAQTPRPSAWGLLPIACAGLVWLLGDLASSNAVTQLAFTALLVLAAASLLGMPATRTLIFPLGFLFFAVPVGEFLLPQMMEWTADFTVFALRLSGIPVYREGLQFVIPSGNWSVVEACSGIRYLIASFMVGVLFAYVNYRSLRRRLIFTVISIVVPVLANWVRAYLIVLIGHLSGNTLAVGVDHLVYGWIFFGVVITLMFMIGARWSEAPAQALTTALPLPPAAPAGPVPVRPAAGARAWAVAGAAAVLALAPHLALQAIERTQASGAVRLSLEATLAAGWREDGAAPLDWKPAFDGAAAEVNQGYVKGGQHVGLYVGYYRQQDATHKMVSSDNVLVTHHDANWSPVSTGLRPLQTPGAQLTLQTAELRGSSHPGQPEQARLIAWQTYWVGGTWTASDFLAKGLGAWHRLLGRGDDSAVVVVYTVQAPGAGAEAALESFLTANLDTLARQLSRARDGR